MARKRSSAAEDLMDIVSLLPWWVGIVLAIASYLILHRIAGAPLPSATQPGQLSAMMTGMLIGAFATAGQYFLPLIFTAGAGISVVRRRKRAQLLSSVKGGGINATALVNDMSWQEFEMLVGEAFRQKGFKVIEAGGGGADGGVDLVLLRGNEKHLVQCKQWKAFKVGVDVVRELYGVMSAQGAAGGYVVTSGQFTSDAKSFAQGRNVALVDGPQLASLIGTARSTSQRVRAVAPVKVEPAVQAERSIQCPLCASQMLKRVASKGQNRGKEFWGCSAYPKCRGTREA